MPDISSALPLLRLRGLHKSFGALQVLKGIDLDVQPGSVMVLIGPSGSGKSTLIRMLNGLVQPDQGTVELSGKQLTRTAKAPGKNCVCKWEWCFRITPCSRTSACSTTSP